jgi:hypothetical protein
LHPQLIATSRHLTGGGVDLVDLKWDGRILHGESKLVARDPYTLFITAPMGYRFENFECKTLAPEKIEREGMLVKITLLPETSGKVTWSAVFSPISPE